MLCLLVVTACAGSRQARDIGPAEGCYRLRVVDSPAGSGWAARFPLVLELTTTPVDSARHEAGGTEVYRAFTWEKGERAEYPCRRWSPAGGDSLEAGPGLAHAGIVLRAHWEDGRIAGRIVPFTDVVAPGDTGPGAADGSFAVRGEAVACR